MSIQSIYRACSSSQRTISEPSHESLADIMGHTILVVKSSALTPRLGYIQFNSFPLETKIVSSDYQEYQCIDCHVTGPLTMVLSQRGSIWLGCSKVKGRQASLLVSSDLDHGGL